jgi:hypothetical protein
VAVEVEVEDRGGGGDGDGRSSGSGSSSSNKINYNGPCCPSAGLDSSSLLLCGKTHLYCALSVLRGFYFFTN